MSVIESAIDDLPIEEDDVTATEAHERLKELLSVGLAWRLAGRALVIGDIFVAIGRRQVSPDILIRFGALRGERSRYIVDIEGVPDVTIEILSTVNHTTIGLIKQQEKRDLFGEIGVAEHIEIDPISSTIQVWSSDRGLSRSVFVGKEWASPALGIVFRFVGDAFEALDDAGRPFEEPAAALARADAETVRADAETVRADAETVRADAETVRADAETVRADAEAVRADRLRQLLELHGIDPDAS